jgi:TolB-like protein
MKAAKSPGKRAVRAQLERIVKSPDFDTSERSREFLRFVVEETLAGRESSISQYLIGTMVFRRGNDFDPATDPIVRMQAARVRRSLERYYLTSGAEDAVIIDIPKGAYAPVSCYREPVRNASSDDVGSAELAEEQADSDSWPTLMVTPFRNLTGKTELDFIGQGLASDLAIELDCYQEIRVFLAATPSENRVESRARFTVEGSVSAAGDTLKISVQLVDGMTQRQVWGHHFKCKPSDPQCGVSLDELAQTLAATVAEEQGILARHVSQQARSGRRAQLGTYEAILRYYHHETTQSLSTHHEAMAALRHAVDVEPENGLAWSLLGRLYATNYALELTDDETPIEDALEFAKKSVRLEPNDQRTRSTLAHIHLLNDEIEDGRREADRALSLNPKSLFFLDSIGCLLTLLGDWERGPALAQKAVRLNPYHRNIVHAGLWLDALRRRDYESAYGEANEFTPAGLWQLLMRITALAYLGRMDKARADVEQLLLIKPNIRERGRWYITRYVKFDELVERITNGLANAGLLLA